MAEEVAGTVRGLGRRAVVVGANLEAPEEIARLFDEVGAMFGALDIFVANHAATAFKSTLEVKPHHLQRTFDLIVRSLVLCVQRAVPLMRGREGAIVTIGGQGTVECLPNYALLAGRAVRDGADDRGRRRARTRHRALRSVPPGRGGSGMNKVVTCEEVVAQIEDGATVAIGGSSLSRKPMALVRALARSNRKNL